MKTFTAYLILSFLILSNAFCLEKDMARSWFNDIQYSSLEIIKTKAGKEKETKSITIKDQPLIAKYMEKIQMISPNGDMMKSFLVDETIFLNFKNEKNKTSIEIYDGRFKTPSTGFNTDSKEIEREKNLYNEINALLR